MLAIIVMVASMAAPQMISMLRESVVFEAADQIREATGDARRFAIDSGIDYEFRYEINGNNLVVLPSEQEQQNDSITSDENNERFRRTLVELPAEIRLQAADDVEEVPESLDGIVFGNLKGDNLAQKIWSKPLLFRFDGTAAEDFELRVSDAQGLTSKVTVRSLTGAARVSQVFQEDD